MIDLAFWLVAAVQPEKTDDILGNIECGPRADDYAECFNAGTFLVSSGVN